MVGHKVTPNVNAAEGVAYLDVLLRMTPALERRFEADSRSDRISMIRTSILVGLVFHNIYNLTSLVFMRDAILVGIVLRLGLVTCISLLFWSLVPYMSARSREAVLFCGMITVASVPVFLLLYSKDPRAIYSTMELYLAMVYAGMLPQLRFPYMLAFTIIAVIEGCVAFLVKPDLPPGTVAGFMLQLGTVGAFTLYGNYRFERTQRRSYLRTLQEITRSEGLEADKTILTTLSSSDPLTGLANRRALDAALKNHSGTSMALLVIDVDYFKRFNDTYGHIEGDRCLRSVAQALTLPFRSDRNLVARYGGEEFAVLLPGQNEREALRAAEKVRTAVEDLAIDHAERADGIQIVTISVGVAAAIGGCGIDPADLLAEADAALYIAKRLGRNRCEARSHHLNERRKGVPLRSTGASA